MGQAAIGENKFRTSQKPRSSSVSRMLVFRDRLASATGGDRDRAVAFYCKAACWMSWNAAKRAVEYGYRHVLWFPGGTEAWAEAGYRLRQGTPEAVPVGP